MSAPGTTSLYLAAWLAIGMAIYVLFGRRNAMRVRAAEETGR